MSKTTHKLILLLSFLLLQSSFLQAKEIELGGLLLDNTISRQGHEFASQLSQYWREVPDASGKNLIVKEVIVPQAGTMLSVLYDDKLVYRTYMGRRQTPMNEKVQQAIILVLDAVANSQFEQRSPDLAGDEW
ncbi:CsgE family curli-type amyloid fiber assembly protein [Glaciecola sp. 1036]|uniref:CsgE family curli-type amyloid fiber assembly protein n=1 Tax=Alteromonadaceae TaxID=72275 RepID=UPI003CFE205F